MTRRVLATFFLVTLIAVPAWASNDPGLTRQWGMDKIGAPTAWGVGRGAGILIATVDSGVDLNHKDLAGKFHKGIDFVDGDQTPQDGDGHGTHVAGIATALTGNGIGVAGVAPDARLIVARIFDDDGDAHADMEDGINWAVANGAQVINVSAGTYTQAAGQDELLFGPAFRESVENAWSKGVIVVLAAGNQFLLSSGYSTQPALVVSSTDNNDQKPDFSSGVGESQWGISAPGGSDTTDSIEDDIYSTDTGNKYSYKRGTSMSAPHVTGAAAVLRGLGLSPRATVDRLLSTAKDLGPPGKDSTFGHGRLDLARAVQGLSAAPPAGPASGGSSSSSSRPSAGSAGTRSGSTEPSTEQSSPDGEAAPKESSEAEEGESEEATVASRDSDEPTRGTGNIIALGFLGLLVVGYFVWQWWAKRKVPSS